MSAAARRIQALNGASGRIHLARRPALDARQFFGRGQRSREGGDLDRLVRRPATERQRNGLLAAAADLQPVPQAVGRNRLGRRVAVDHGLAHDFVRAEASLDHAVALDALETRARRIDAALRAHIDDILEIRAEAHDELRRHRAQREIAHADHLVADPRPDESRARDVQRAARQR